MNKNNVNPFNFNYISWLPKNLDLDDLLNNNPIAVKTHSKRPDRIRNRLAFVIGSLSSAINSSMEDSVIQTENEYVGLCTEFIADAFREYSPYMNYAIKMGIFEVGGGHSKGFSCTPYRFSLKYRNKVKNPYYIYESSFVESIYRRQQDNKAKSKYDHLFTWLKSITINRDDANVILNNLAKKNSYTRHLQSNCLHRIEDARKATFRTGETGRLYTTFSNLHEDLRTSLRINGQPLVSIDISNSLPFFFTSLFLKQVVAKHSIDILLGDINVKQRGERGEGGWYILADIANSDDLSIGYPDIVLFIDAVKHDTLYDDLAEAWNKKGSKSYNRKTAKRKLLSILSSPNGFQSIEKDILKSLYPNVMEAVEVVNTGYYSTKNGKGKRKRKKGDQVCGFAHLTQMLESKVLLDVVCKTIEEVRPDIPILPLHDSIFTTPEYVEDVKTFLKQGVKDFIGFEPSLKIKDCGK